MSHEEKATGKDKSQVIISKQSPRLFSDILMKLGEFTAPGDRSIKTKNNSPVK